ncbi:MAG: ABC-F family ATP-binding cassette domain-containing protein [Armatimonadetes bacterium]|nr:ABC-F family ATP-binding cassette domain-containing protein [Armatimonadota bacterium]
MTILGLENVGKDFGIKPLFSGVTFSIESGERVGLIGANGSGKTTLLRVIAGQEHPETGRVMFSGNPVVGYLPQNPPFNPDATVLDTIFTASSAVMQQIHDYEAACQQLAANGDDPGLLARVADLAAQLESSGGWSLETEAKIILDRLGITDTAARMGTLSGGQRKRVALAHALIEHPDLLILDEPTNHLDADTINWLERYLDRYNGALLLVTHDRYFLDRVTRRIIEVDRGKVQAYAGNYSYYLTQKEEEAVRREVEDHKRDMLIRQELAWLRRGAKARTTKQKARIDRANELMETPRERKSEGLEIAVGARRLGSKVAELHAVGKQYDGRWLLRNFTHILQPGERLGIIGPNGTGKTTLMELITGRIQPDEGKIVVGDTVVIGYYDQESRALDDEQRVIEYIREVAENITTADGSVITASQMLERFLFPGPMQYSPIGKLSGGERRRLYLLRVLMSAPNVLILDEPTNDLDIPTLQTLESYLDGFGGVLIVVSHDRYFLDRTVEHLFRFEGDGTMREYPGNYSAFLEIQEREAAEAATQAQSTQGQSAAAQSAAAQSAAAQSATKISSDETQPSTAPPRKLSYKERKELEQLEQDIEKGEQRKSEIEQQLAAADYTTAQALAETLEQITAQLERDVERWSQLAELA